MRKYSFLTKLTIFGSILCTLPLLFFGFFSYLQSSEQIRKQVNRGQAQLLAQMNANVEQTLLTVNHALNQLVDSTVISKVMTEPFDSANYKLYSELRKEMSNAQSSYTKVDDIVIVNAKQNWMIKNSGFYRFDQYLHHAQIRNQLMLPGTISWALNPSIWFYSEETANAATCSYTISLVKKLPAKSLDKYGLAYANISTCSLSDMIKYTPSESETVMILDDFNRVLYASDASLIGKYVNDTGFISDPAMLSQPSGQFEVKLNRETYTATYQRSTFNDWVYLSVISIDSLTYEVKKTERYTIIVCLLIVAVFIAIARMGSRQMYSPIGRLVKQFNERAPQRDGSGVNEFDFISDKVQDLFRSQTRLEQEAYGHLLQARTFFLIKMFQGAYRLKDLEERLSLFGLREKLAKWPVMSVITLQIDTLENTRYTKDDMDLLVFAVNNIIEEIMPEDVRLPAIAVDQTSVILIGSKEEAAAGFDSFLYSVTESIQQTIRQVLSLQVSIGISLPFDEPKKASIAYREGLEALKHRIHLGEGIIIRYSNINDGKHQLQLQYPGLTQSELFDAIMLAEEDKARERLKHFMQTVFERELAPQEYQVYFFRLLSDVLVMMQQSGIALSKLAQGEGSLYEELNKLPFAAEIEEWFWSRLTVPLIQIFRDRQNSQYQNISEKIIDMIHRNYDNDITIEQCAETLHYNANYLSGVFRKETNMTFSEYLAGYRLGMAKKLLRETDMTIKDIAEKLRYMNSQNFIRSFRKQEGVTPGQYRSMQQHG